jgi:Transposase DDE domain
VQIDLIDDVMHHSVLEMHLSDGTAADQGRALAIVPHLRQNDLGLRDLGYVRLASLRQIEAQDAWYLSRLSKGVDVYLEADAQAPALVLVAHFQRYSPHESVIDLPVLLGHERVPCRLLAYRLPDHVVQERRRKALEEARKKGRTLSQAYRDWLAFGVYITNVPQQIWPPKGVGTVYRLRWQVELTFKNWQSLLHIHVLKGTRPARIACMLYGRLITITMVAMISSDASWYAEDYVERALSLPKLIHWLQRKDRFVNAMPGGTFEALFRNLRRVLPTLLCKQKRKRRTSRQLLEEYGPYMEDALVA